jgi:hypothetical protein
MGMNLSKKRRWTTRSWVYRVNRCDMTKNRLYGSDACPAVKSCGAAGLIEARSYRAKVWVIISPRLSARMMPMPIRVKLGFMMIA